jgi:ATP-dependent helicase/nuclease subunit B
MPPVGSLRFILGRAGSGKTTQVVREISQLLRDDPLGDPILLLVPDQATLLYERLVACGNRGSDVGAGISGYLRLEVITFRRLIEKLLKDAGGSAIPEITPLGRRILIGRLLRKLQPQLTYYKSTARQPGLAARLDEAFAEIERSGRDVDDLLFIAGDVEAQNARSPLPAKLRDLHLLLREYETVLGSGRLDQHRRFALAAVRTGDQGGRDVGSAGEGADLCRRLL